MESASLTGSTLSRTGRRTSWSRISHGPDPSTSEAETKGKPKGAKAKLPRRCRQLLFQHDFYESHPGYADAGVSRVRVLGAGENFELELERRATERDLHDWGPALALVDELLDQHRPELTTGARVVELGCGLGLPGMVCAALGADVLLTDQASEAESLELADLNIRSNFMGPARRPPGPNSGRASVRAFTWGEESTQELIDEEGDFDLVICADCVYQPLYGKSWLQLGASFEALCGPDTKILFTLQRRPHDGVDEFLDYLVQDLRLLVQKLVHSKHVANGVEIYTLRRPSRSETFHVDVQCSAAKEDFHTVVDFWRGTKAAEVT